MSSVRYPVRTKMYTMLRLSSDNAIPVVALSVRLRRIKTANDRKAQHLREVK